MFTRRLDEVLADIDERLRLVEAVLDLESPPADGTTVSYIRRIATAEYELGFGTDPASNAAKAAVAHLAAAATAAANRRTAALREAAEVRKRARAP